MDKNFNEYAGLRLAAPIQNIACVTTIADDFTKITLAFTDATKNFTLDDKKYAS